MQPIKIIVTLTPDTVKEEFSRLSLKVESEQPVYYDTVINALVAVLDNIVQEKQKTIHEENNLQLEQSSTTTTEEGK